MDDSPRSKPGNRFLPFIVIIGFLIVLTLAAIRFWPTRTDTTGAPAASQSASEAGDAETSGKSPSGADIPYDQVTRDESLKSLMAERKEKYRVEEGVDVIAQSDETVTIQGNRISMKEIQELIRQKTGEIAEESISPDGSPGGQPLEMLGIYVVQPGDNIWNIHFRFLKDHFQQKQIGLSPKADEPDSKGYSSGIGKLLKFSENLVYIYNIKDKKLDTDLHVVEPYSKIIVYKMDMIFELLDNIDYGQIDEIRFDGDTLWIPPAS